MNYMANAGFSVTVHRAALIAIYLFIFTTKIIREIFLKID